MESKIKPGKYRHYKGKDYLVLHTARHSETLEDMVVYRALYGERGVWVRPAAMWEETVEGSNGPQKRFTPIEKILPERLYYQNAYEKSFQAKVLSCEPKKDAFSVILDHTAFYPEGGGQPADTGSFGEARVLDVHEKEGVVIHTMDKPFEPGDIREGAIDWERRFLFMQQHTGEHILSGLANRLYGVDNVGFHMGAKAVTVDLSSELDEAQVRRLERLVNKAIAENLPVQAEYPAPEELETIPYRSKKELSGAVRIVTIPGCDICACCGLHTAFTGEVGMVKITGFQRYKGGTRLFLAAGSRALEDYGEKEASVQGVSVLLSAKPEEIVPAVEHLLEEQGALKQELSALKNKLYAIWAQEVPQGSARACLFEEEMKPGNGDLCNFCQSLCERAEVAAVFSGNEESGWKYALGSKNADVRPLGKAFNEAFSGRGGGKPGLVQGSVSGTQEELKKFIMEL